MFITDFWISKDSDKNINTTITETFGDCDFDVLKTHTSKYGATTYTVQVNVPTFNCSSVNVGYFDDYRPGIAFVVVINKDGKKRFINYSISAETEHARAVNDASIEDKEAYTAARLYERRKDEIIRDLEIRKNDMRLAKEMGLKNRHMVTKLRKATPEGNYFYEATKLLRSYHADRLRSSFRMSLALQITNWLLSDENRFNSPLSPKQWSYLMPKKFY